MAEAVRSTSEGVPVEVFKRAVARRVQIIFPPTRKCAGEIPRGGSSATFRNGFTARWRIICATAAAGQIIVSESTLALLGNRFEFEELDAQSLKGKEKPMRRFNVVREKPSAVAKVG